jgi:hypothetical protein
MAASTTTVLSGFSETALRGLVSLGPIDGSPDDLALELGLSVWMHQCDVDIDGASDALWNVRGILLEVANFDPRSEPIPFSGRSPKLDLVNLAAYLGRLVFRVSAATQCAPSVVAEWVTQIATGVVPAPAPAQIAG